MAWKNRWGTIEKGTIGPKIMKTLSAHKSFENKRSMKAKESRPIGYFTCQCHS